MVTDQHAMSWAWLLVYPSYYYISITLFRVLGGGKRTLFFFF